MYLLCFCVFSDCKPTESEVKVWTDIQGVLEGAMRILEGLKQYTGAAEVIRNVNINTLFFSRS